MNQGRHPGREATRRVSQQAKAKHPALIAFIHSRILPHLRVSMRAAKSRSLIEAAQAQLQKEGA
jgi:hypothetical protein